jgi:predicted Zn-dependent peptidase
MATGRIGIYFSGDLPLEEAERALAPLVEARARVGGAAAPLPPLPAPRRDGAGREVVERMPIQQANLVQSYRTGIPFAERRMPGLVIGNGILGAFAHSKLFVNVREGASLCYSTGSSLERTHGMLFISSGIDAARYVEARTLIEVQVEDVRAGRFTDEELDATKRAFEARLRMLDDSPGARMDIDLTWQVNGHRCDLVAWREKLAAVTRDDVVEAFAPLAADVVYLLAPTEK